MSKPAQKCFKVLESASKILVSPLNTRFAAVSAKRINIFWRTAENAEYGYDKEILGLYFVSARNRSDHIGEQSKKTPNAKVQNAIFRHEFYGTANFSG